jgi:chromosome partitioning protein
VTIAVANYKGGSGKTTSAAFIAHVLHETGRRVAVADADRENQSLVKWSAKTDLPFPVFGLPVANLHRQLPGLIGDEFDAVVIDTPPMKDERAIVVSALRAATHVVIPMAPTKIEYEELEKMPSAIEEACASRDEDPAVAVLFNRVRVKNSIPAQGFRELIQEEGLTVLAASIPLLELYGQAYGSPIVGAASGPYGEAVKELLKA